MQDPNDGGVYFKTTNQDMDGWAMPEDATTARYVVQKSTASTLDFAAIMAMSARILPISKLNCLDFQLPVWQLPAVPGPGPMPTPTSISTRMR